MRTCDDKSAFFHTYDRTSKNICCTLIRLYRNLIFVMLHQFILVIMCLERVAASSIPCIHVPWAVCQITGQVLGDRLLIPFLITGASYKRPEALCIVNVANRPNGERAAGAVCVHHGCKHLREYEHYITY